MNDQSPAKPVDERTGAILVSSGLCLPEIWQTLHANAREWRNVPRNARFYDLREMLDDSDRQILNLMREVEAVQWEQICNGAGWTAIGAMALSWCQDRVEFARVADRWALSGAGVSRDENCLRTAQFLFAGCRPSVDTLSGLVTQFEGNVDHVSLALAAWPGAFANDYSEDVIQTAPAQIRDHLIAP